MIRTEGLTKKFNNFIAVDNLSLEIKRGEFFAFLGPNAAGKTTTIKMLTGLIKPTSGKAYIGGYDIQDDYIEARSLIAYIPDFPFLYEKLTAKEFVEFIGELYGIERKKLEKEYSMYFELLGLTGYKNHLIEDFSHGMKQKLIFTAAFIHDPKVIIIDEPMVGLDPHSARAVKDILKAKLKKGVTIFVSTHTLSFAEELADRIAIIDKGRLVAEGTFDTLSRISGIKGKLEDVFLRITEEENRTDIKDV
jgi:ABC-2 type transport system ATP-binding protein